MKDKSINDEDYLRVFNVLNVLKMKTIGDYHDFYLKTDVLLLADVSGKFISVYLEFYYGLYPCLYFSSLD